MLTTTFNYETNECFVTYKNQSVKINLCDFSISLFKEDQKLISYMNELFSKLNEKQQGEWFQNMVNHNHINTL